MDASHLQELISLEDQYWWHVAKRELIVSMVTRRHPAPGRIVEGGIGSARNLLEFQRRGYEVAGLDVMPAAVAYAQSRGLPQVWEHDLQETWPVAAAWADAVVLLDVLEHVADPVQVLRHAATALRPGGAIFFTVPAYPWLYSDWDRQLGHYRRYTMGMLRRQVKQADLQLERLGYWNAFSLPAAIAVRLYQRLLPANRTTDFPRVSSTVNRLLVQAAACERPLARLGRIPCGLSLVGVIQR